MAQRTINFSSNHNNKLDCDYYTTIRPCYEGYYSCGERYGIMLKGKFHHEGEILHMRKFKIKDINPYVSFLDAGCSPEYLRGIIRQMYGNKFDINAADFYFILIKKHKS